MNARQRRWLGFLNEYDFEIKYIKGKENKVVDTLIKRGHVAAMSSYEAEFQ